MTRDEIDVERDQAVAKLVTDVYRNISVKNARKWIGKRSCPVMRALRIAYIRGREAGIRRAQNRFLPGQRKLFR